MKIRRFLPVFLLTCLLCAFLTPQALALEDPDIHAKAAILVDGETGTVLYDKNMHEELPMASITKVMSALLVLEAVDRGGRAAPIKLRDFYYTRQHGGSQLWTGG